MLHEDLGLKAYKIHTVPKLNPTNFDKRLEFAEWLLKQPVNFVENFICWDEAYVCLTESRNSQNNRIWSEELHLDEIEKPLHDMKISVWCAISAKRVFGPYYFSEKVNGENYLEML